MNKKKVCLANKYFRVRYELHKQIIDKLSTFFSPVMSKNIWPYSDIPAIQEIIAVESNSNASQPRVSHNPTRWFIRINILSVGRESNAMNPREQIDGRNENDHIDILHQEREICKLE